MFYLVDHVISDLFRDWPVHTDEALTTGIRILNRNLLFCQGHRKYIQIYKG